MNYCRQLQALVVVADRFVRIDGPGRPGHTVGGFGRPGRRTELLAGNRAFVELPGDDTSEHIIEVGLLIDTEVRRPDHFETLFQVEGYRWDVLGIGGQPDRWGIDRLCIKQTLL